MLSIGARVGPSASPIVLGLLLLGFPANQAAAQASGDVAGLVVSDSTGAPVSQASVELRGSDGMELLGGRLQTVTGTEGRFLIRAVPEGLYLVRIDHLTYGPHDHPLRVEGRGSASVRIEVSPTAVTLAPVLVSGDAARERAELSRPSSRNTITRERLAEAAASGLRLGGLLRRDVAGMSVRQPYGGITSDLCVEFRGARREDGPCRPPQVFIDGIAVPDPQSILGGFGVSGLERIRVLPPAEAGSRFGPNAAWGVVLLETRRRGLDPDAGIPVLQRRELSISRYDWDLEFAEHASGRVFTAALIGNAVGLATGGALLSQCMDLARRRIYRGEDYCGAGPMLGSAVLAAALPTLGGSLAARWAGATDVSRGRLGRSILFSLPVYVPGFAIATLGDGGGGVSALDVASLTLLLVGAPLLNTLSDRLFRDARAPPGFDSP